MTRLSFLFTWAVFFGWQCTGLAAIIVNPAQPITHRVTMQIIETAPDGGTPPATIFGSATQRANIEAGIDSIWAQAGIDIAWLPTIIRYNSTFAYQGTTNNPRPTGDLGQIINNATAAGKINPTASVLNMFFVNLVPGSSPVPPPIDMEDTVNGIANIANDGSAVFVGDNLLTFQNGRDAIAKVIAHEIGHNLGLTHTAAGGPNLMSSSNGTTAYLTAGQVNEVFQDTIFPQRITTVLLGDYNGDGAVNSADYAVWRNTLGSTTNLAADGNGNNRIDDGDYTVWRSRFGATSGGGATALASIPEPATGIYFAALFVGLAISRSLDRRTGRRDRR